MLKLPLALICLFTLAPASLLAQNLVVNPGFEDGMKGWPTVWSRDDHAITSRLDTEVKHQGAQSLHVTHTGTRDWSVAQDGVIPVKPGEILRVSGWVKCQDTQSVQFSIETMDANADAIDWVYCAATANGSHDWQQVTRRCIIPARCTQVRFRVVGEGKCDAWMDEVSLTREGNIATMQSGVQGGLLTLQNSALSVTVDRANGTLAVTDKRNHRTWNQRVADQALVVRKVEKRGASAVRFSLWNIDSDLTVTADISLLANKPEIAVSLSSSGKLDNFINWPQPFVTAKGTWLIVPMNEGIMYPVDDQTVEPIQLVGYSGHGICMRWYGAIDPKSGAGQMTILDTPDDARIDIARPVDKVLSIRPQWEPQRGAFGYTRKLTYVFTTKGGYVAQAKRYREYAKAIGIFKTLAQKRKENPKVDLLIGAANVWNWDMNCVTVCREMHDLGWNRVLWSNEAKPNDIAEVNKLGYLSGRYDIYQDVWPESAKTWLPHEGWPEDLVWLPNGDWMKGWADIDHLPDGTTKVYQGGVICSSRGILRAKQRIPKDLADHPYGARFIDTTTASPWRECWNPAHPLTRSEDRVYKMKLLEYCSKDEKMVVGTETGIDPSVPYVHYYEGMLSLGPYRLPDAGYDMMGYRTPTPDFLKYMVGHYYRIPLWELVFHDCVVAHWYWGDYNNKAPEVWDRRDMFNMLYGTAPMYMFTKQRWDEQKQRMTASYKRVTPVARRLGYDEMLSHEFVSSDHAVQRTRWRSGAEVVVNFGDTPCKLSDGRTVGAMQTLVK